MLLDYQFVNKLVPYVQRFTKIGEYSWKFRCPFCGDSQKSIYKARGHLFRKSNDLLFKCHNCGHSSNLLGVLKQVSPTLASQYIFEKFKSNERSEVEEVKKEPERDTPVELLETVFRRLDKLPEQHMARQYFASRRLPEHALKLFFHADHTCDILNIVPKYKELKEHEEPRLVIPFFSRHSSLIYLAARSYESTHRLRYVTLRVSETHAKVYGLERLDYSKKIYVTEGQFDSLFLPNCLAAAASDFTETLRFAPKFQTTVVYDNDRRNKEIINKVYRTIKQGYSVCLFPDTIKEKDLNDIILSGASEQELKELVDKNTYSGLQAELAFNNWKKL